MKFQLREKDYVEKHHLLDLIHKYISDHDGDQPEYVIVHPETYHKILMTTNERNDDFLYSYVQFNYTNEKPVTTIYGLSFIRSYDVEADFVIIT